MTGGAVLLAESAVSTVRRTCDCPLKSYDQIDSFFSLDLFPDDRKTPASTSILTAVGAVSSSRRRSAVGNCKSNADRPALDAVASRCHFSCSVPDCSTTQRSWPAASTPRTAGRGVGAVQAADSSIKLHGSS